MLNNKMWIDIWLKIVSISEKNSIFDMCDLYYALVELDLCPQNINSLSYEAWLVLSSSYIV